MAHHTHSNMIKYLTLLAALIALPAMMTAQNFRIIYQDESTLTEAEKQERIDNVSVRINRAIKERQEDDGEEERTARPALPLDFQKRLQKNMKARMDATTTYSLTIVGGQSKWMEDSTSFISDWEKQQRSRSGIADRAHYKDHRAKTATEFMRRDSATYGIQTNYREKLKWNVDRGATKEIGSFTCNRATAMVNDSTEIVAWFTPEILIPDGPQGYAGLPGLILQLDANDRRYTATSVKRLPADAESVAMPEVDRFFEDQQEMYQEIFGGRGGRGRGRRGGRGRRPRW